jgi:signal transduction histidine kinase
MSATPAPPHPDQLASVEAMLAHFQQLEDQLDRVREGLTHSHRLATLGTIASIIAHEYNNILTPVISYAQLALASPENAELTAKALRKAVEGAEKAAHISSSLLGFARETDEQEHAAALGATIEEAVTCLARDPKKDGIELTVDVPDVQVAIPPVNLQQVLVNLMLNARKAMGRGGGRLTLTGRVEADLVHLDVADTGPGIPDAVRQRLFEPFVTAPLHADDPGERKGTGLGLCICRDLVRQAGGQIRVDTAPGRGTTFHLTLPRADDLFAPPED